MRFYNLIPTEVQPPPRVVRLRYADSFDSDFALILRERKYANLDTMMNDAIKVEVNLMALGKLK
jgi:hypothetical protein